MNKEQCIEKLNKIAEQAKAGNYNYEVIIKDWVKDDKSRTYFSIVETVANSKHYVKKDYGYFDNVSQSYFGNKYADLNNNFGFSGARLD